MSLLRSFINANMNLSQWFDQKSLLSSFVLDGNKYFISQIAPSYLRRVIKIYDVGGGDLLLI